MSGAAPSPSLTVVIPAYEEERRLGPTLARAAEWLASSGLSAEIVVVDDGSRDATARVAEEAGARSAVPIRVVRNPTNLGKGASVRRGVAEARGAFVLFSDADLSTPIEEAPRLLAALEEGADVAIGSRAAEGARIEVRQPWYRERMGRTFNAIVRLVAGLGYRDTQCGFKAFRAEAAHDLFGLMKVERFGFDVEILFLAHRRGWRVREVPVVWRDRPDSRVNPLTDAARMAIDVLLLRCRALLGRYPRRRAGQAP